MPKVITSREAAALVQDNMTVAVGGFITYGVPEDCLVSLQKRRTEFFPELPAILNSVNSPALIFVCVKRYPQSRARSADTDIQNINFYLQKVRNFHDGT